MRGGVEGGGGRGGGTRAPGDCRTLDKKEEPRCQDEENLEGQEGKTLQLVTSRDLL